MVVMVMVVGVIVVMMVVVMTMVVISCGWSRAADCDCANNA
jgi:hypothetical protein